MRLKPLADRVVVRRLEADKKTPGGVLLPDNAQHGKELAGKVLAVGPGRRLLNGELAPLECAVGDVVLFVRHSGTEVGPRDEKLTVLAEHEILAVVQD